MADGYSYTIAECDVEDKKALEAFRAKRLQWSQWLDDDPDHAIWGVIHMMIWRDTSFAAISKLALNNPNGPLHTRLLAEAIVDGHIAMQVLALRRLVEPSTKTISLWNLINDVKKHHYLLTRENFVCFDGLPYDYKAAERQFWADKMPSPGIVVSLWVDTTGPLGYSTSERMHAEFDRLASIDPANRSRNDVLPLSLLAKVEGWLNTSTAKDIANWSHKYLAHAAKAEGREAIAHIQVTNDKVSAAIVEVARIAEALAGEILSISGRRSALMPAVQYNVFDGLENPVAVESEQVAAAEVWTAKSSEWDAALEGVRDALLVQR